VELFGEAWAQAYCQKLNESEAYRKAASTWEGSLALALRPDPKAGLSPSKAPTWAPRVAKPKRGPLEQNRPPAGGFSSSDFFSIPRVAGM